MTHESNKDINFKITASGDEAPEFFRCRCNECTCVAVVSGNNMWCDLCIEGNHSDGRI